MKLEVNRVNPGTIIRCHAPTEFGPMVGDVGVVQETTPLPDQFREIATTMSRMYVEWVIDVQWLRTGKRGAHWWPSLYLEVVK